MGWGYRKSFKVMPGVRLTASKRGMSTSVGRKGARVSVNSRGQKSVSAGWKGFFWRKRV
jgi:hypothetical protein